MTGWLIVVLFVIVALLPLRVACADDAAPAGPPAPRPKKIYAHYMACYPSACSAPPWEFKHEGRVLRHDGNTRLAAFGGQWRNWPLLPQDMEVSMEQTMDLEIRRAMRAGIDGFVVDMANEEYWYKVITAMFKVVHEKKYPFEISVCLDGVPDRAGQAKWLIDTYGDSPNLARRDGKPFIAGYYSALQLLDVAAAAMIERDGLTGVTPKDLENDPRLLRFGHALLVPTREIAAELWLRTYRYDDARREARAVLEEHPGRVGPYVVLARTAVRLKDTAAATEAWRRVLALRTTADPDDTIRLEAQRALEPER